MIPKIILKEKINSLFEDLKTDLFSSLPLEETDEIVLFLFQKLGTFKTKYCYSEPPLNSNLMDKIEFAFDCKFDIYSKYQKQNYKYIFDIIDINEIGISINLSIEDNLEKQEYFSSNLELNWKNLNDSSFKEIFSKLKLERFNQLKQTEEEHKKQEEEMIVKNELLELKKLKEKYENYQ